MVDRVELGSERRRLGRIVAIAGMTCCIVVFASTASAFASPSGLAQKLNTTVAGTTSVQGGCAGIVRAVTDATLTGSPALGAATLHLDICVTSTTPNDEFFGTFTLQTRLGTLSGSAVISSPDPPGSDPQRVTGELDPEAGSGPLALIDSPLTLQISLHGAFPAPVTGTLSAS